MNIGTSIIMKIVISKFWQYALAMILSIALFGIPYFVWALGVNHDFPRTTAWQLNANKTPAYELARYDSVILNMNAHQTHPWLFDELRRLNPDIVILAYTTGVEYPHGNIKNMEPAGHGVWHDMGKGIYEPWKLKTTNGSQVSFWEGNWAMNPTGKNDGGQTYANYIGNFFVDSVLSSGKWDGLLFDTTWNTISWHDENIDIDNDGQKDSPQKIDAAWHEGQKEMLRTMRDRIGDDYLLITNGDGQFSAVNNGRMFESFPEFWEGGWIGSIERYLDTDSTTNGFLPRFNIINADTNNSGNFNDYANMRYGLTSTLVGNGYFNFDYGTTDRSFVNYYDEYSVSLGRPVKGAVNLISNIATEIAPGIWQRDFENGISLVNSTTQTRSIQLPGEYEKIHGAQDPYVNSGHVVSDITIPPRDGIILLRPLQEVLGNPFDNGAFARVFSADTRKVRASFFSYDERFDGGQQVLKADIDLDGRIETLVAGKSTITIYADNGGVKHVFYPYTANYNLGINFGIGDLNGDGTQEIVTGTARGGGPQVRVFSADGRLINPGFFAYATNFRGGVNVAVGDLNGDGVNEIVAGAGYGGGPHIRVFDRNGKLISSGFFAYDPSFRGGVNVAVGDINGNGVDEIISGPGPGGGPHVRIWNKNGIMLSEFFAFSAQSTQGVRVGAYDFDGDRRDEIVGMTNDFFLLGS
jgi:hypothetical protein